MTVDVPTWSWLGAVPRAESAASKIVKTGAAHDTNAVPVEVREGALAFDRPHQLWTNTWARMYAPAAGTGMFVAGEGTLGGMTIAPVGDFTATFGATGKRVDNKDLAWTCVEWARVMPDGNTVALTVPHRDSHGAAWLTQKIRVDESFTVSFDYFAHASGSPRRRELHRVVRLLRPRLQQLGRELRRAARAPDDDVDRVRRGRQQPRLQLRLDLERLVTRIVYGSANGKEEAKSGSIRLAFTISTDAPTVRWLLITFRPIV